MALDGPAGVGKTTAGRLAAAALGVPFLDTGITYRAVALQALDGGVGEADVAALAKLAAAIGLATTPAAGLDEYRVTGFDAERLQADRVTDMSSRVAVHPEVRRELVSKQHECARGGIVMVGRDVGTVVLARDATAKFFLKASPSTRALRRADERRDDLGDVAAALQERDRRDKTRTASPLAPAPDAITIDTDNLSTDAVAELIVRTVRERME